MRGRGAYRRLLDRMGGQAQTRVVLLLSAVLGLNGVDIATLSAVSVNIERAMGIGYIEIGVLVSMVPLAGVLGTLPFGMLTDRVRRTRLLALAIPVWTVAMVGCGAANSYLALLVWRIVLGVAAASTYPAVASLTGDYFLPAVRAWMYGMILCGELIGTGIGFVLSADIAILSSWRVAFWWLTLPGLVIAYGMWRLPEPARGAQSRWHPNRSEGRETQWEAGAAERAVRGQKIPPHREVVLDVDPRDESIWWAVRYTLRIRSNRIIILASALSYLFFAAIRAFAIIFVVGHYAVTQAIASALTIVVGVGGVAGAILGGRLTDHLLRCGRVNARVTVPGLCLFAVVLAFGPAIALTAAGAAVPLLTAGAFLLGAASPALDAARLDIVHPAVWGRAESVRTVFRLLAEAVAPTLLGYLADSVLGGGPQGLGYGFELFLFALLIAGSCALLARRTYPGDVAAVAASFDAAR